MHRDSLAVDRLALWAQLHNIVLNGVTISATANAGHGIFATSDWTEEARILITVPQDLVLSLENVWIYAKSDQHLRQVLEAVGDYARTARGAILIFLLVQITHTASEGKIGASNPFTEYVKYLPAKFALPTFFDNNETLLLVGTSLDAALASKLKTLDREFSLLHNRTSRIDWCRQFWWNQETGDLTIDDWKQVDAIYRSRALDLPGTGHATVPVIDMANHNSGEETTALYETDGDGNAVLVLRDGKKLSPGDEITITYGDEKGACEMLFSYGFIESSGAAKELFLDLEIPDDDPLKLAKMAFSKSAPGFRLYERAGSVQWEGPFVWLLCVNEEDGLQFKVLQRVDGSKELQGSWNDGELTDISNLGVLLEQTSLWNVYLLRAITVLQLRVEQQLLLLERSKASIGDSLKPASAHSPSVGSALKLRDAEESLMLRGYKAFDEMKTRLLDSAVVQNYLTSVEDVSPAEEDFASNSIVRNG